MLTLATVVDRLSKLDLFTRPFKGVEKRKNKQTNMFLPNASSDENHAKNSWY